MTLGVLIFLAALLLAPIWIPLVAITIWFGAALIMGAITAVLYGVRAAFRRGVLHQPPPEKLPYNPDVFPIVPDA